MAGLDGAAPWRVFVSATSELREFPAGVSYVAAVEQAIAAAGHMIVDMADFPAADQPPAQMCEERVRGCDVYVGILGTRWGSPVRDKPEVSYTELEFNTATETGLPRLLFLLDTTAADVGIPLSRLIDREYGARQDAFRSRVLDSALVTQSFADPATLGQLVERSLRELAQSSLGPGPQPRSVPPAWNIPARNPGFTGRERLLTALREQLLAGDRAVVQALMGLAGVGKTQLAAEYAHRFADSYDVAWWVNAEQPSLIGDQFAALGAALGSVPAGAGIEVTRAAVLADLRSRGRWLLVFDNAESPADITGWLPGGAGHVLITSRERAWTEIAVPVEVDVLDRRESMAILQSRVAGLDDGYADLIAGELGDLPLAIAQAAGFMAEAGVPAAQYLELLRAQAGRLLEQAPPAFYPRSLAATIQLIASRLGEEDPAAAQLASLCAFLAPGAIPEDLFTTAPGELPSELAAKAASPLAWRQTLARLTRQSLARIDQYGLQFHRLTQVILRDSLTPEEAAATRESIAAILAASDPRDPGNPGTWPRWAQLMPHLLFAGLSGTDNAALHQMACNACYYLLARGDTGNAHDLASGLFQDWSARLGSDDLHAQAAAIYLAWGFRNMARYAEARDLDQDSLERRRRILGEDHPRTLSSASNLAADLREMEELQAARELDEDTLQRRRLVLGEDHPHTLQSGNNLAIDLRLLGEPQAAHNLDAVTLDQKGRVLGNDHPSTLTSASNLAIDLRLLGELQAARELDEDTLARKRRVFGDDHPSTLTSAGNLAIDLRLLGELQAARDLDEDTLQRRRRALGEDHPHTRQSASNLAEDRRLLEQA